MSALPGRARAGNDLDHRGRLLVDPFGSDLRSGLLTAGKDVGQHGCQFVLAAEMFNDLGVPLLTLLGVRTRFVLGLACFEGGSLRQRDGLRRRGFAAMVALELFGEFVVSVLDRSTPRRHEVNETVWNTDDFAHRTLATDLAFPFGITDGKPFDHVALKAGVVHLRGSHHRLENRPAIECEPAGDPVSAGSAHLP